MRDKQNEVGRLGTYGCLYESVEEPKREIPRRKINPDVEAWRFGRRARNPATEFIRVGWFTL